MIYVGSHARSIATYKGPPWPQAVATVPATPEEVADWRRRHTGATCSDKVASILAQLERDFSIRSIDDAR